MTPTISALISQVKRAQENASLGIVTHMSLGMTNRVTEELDHCEEEERVEFIQLMGHSSIVDINDTRSWCVTLAR